MHRKKNLYEKIYNIDNIISSYEEVCKNTKNKNKVDKYKEYKCIYIARIYAILKTKSYIPGPYNKFTIYEPKERKVASQGMQDKTINHLVARYILHPALLPCLLDVNVASRKNLGTSKGLEFFNNFTKKCKINYKTYYILKCDISKFFASINQDILKEKLTKRIKDQDALDIVFKIIDSEPSGLNIGSMTSQVLAIFYLNDMDHFIKENLKIKYYLRYQDDFLLFHPSKSYLKYCLEEIKKFLANEKLVLNNKTRLYKCTNNFIFIGRNKNGKYTKYRDVRRKLRKKRYLYQNNKIRLNNFACSLISYENLSSKKGALLAP